MSNWLNVKNCLPLDGTIITVRWSVLYSITKKATFVKKHFIHEGQDITAWVNHWAPL